MTLDGGPVNRFWTLSCPERETDHAIGFGDLNLVHFHTPHLTIRQREPKLLASQFALLSSSQDSLRDFTRRAFKGCRSYGSWIQMLLQNWGAFPKKICKIQPKSLLPASFPGKKVGRVGPVKCLSEGGKWGLVEQA